MPNIFFLFEFCTNGALIRIKFWFVTTHPRAYIRRPPHAWNSLATHTNPRALAFVSFLYFLVFGFLFCSGRFWGFGDREKAEFQVRRRRFSIVLDNRCLSLYPGRQTSVEASCTYRRGRICFKESVFRVPRQFCSLLSFEFRLYSSGVIYSPYLLFQFICSLFMYNILTILKQIPYHRWRTGFQIRGGFANVLFVV